jgi:hypothetical protein
MKDINTQRQKNADVLNVTVGDTYKLKFALKSSSRILKYFGTLILVLFWILAPYRLVGICQRFGETSSGLKPFSPSYMMMETVYFFETLTSTYESTRHQSPEQHHHPHRRENLKSYILEPCYGP